MTAKTSNYVRNRTKLERMFLSEHSVPVQIQIRRQAWTALRAPLEHPAVVAFHFGAMYVLQIAQQVIADRSGEEVSLALGMLDAELEQFMKAHAIAVH
jgi:hypothetical protein